MQIRIIWLEFGQLKGDFQATKIVIDEVARIFHVKHIEFPKLNLFFPKNSNFRYTNFIAKSSVQIENVLVVLNEMGEKRTNDGVISEFK